MRKLLIVALMTVLLLPVAINAQNGLPAQVQQAYSITWPEGWNIEQNDRAFILSKREAQIFLLPPNVTAELVMITSGMSPVAVLIEAYNALTDQAIDQNAIEQQSFTGRSIASVEFEIGLGEKRGMTIAYEVQPGDFGLAEFQAPVSDFDALLPEAYPIMLSLHSTSSITINGDNGQFEVEGFEIYQSAGSNHPQRDVFLVLFGTLHNTTSDNECFRARSVRIYLDGQEYKPQNEVMDEVKSILAPPRDFLGAYQGHCLQGQTSELTFAAFDIPSDFEVIEVAFQGQEANLNSNLIIARADVVGRVENTESTIIPDPTDSVSPTDIHQSTSTPRITSTRRPSATSTRIPQGVTVTTSNTVNLRGGPGTNYALAGKLTAGRSAKVIARNAAGDWLLLESGSWVATWVVTVNGEVSTLSTRSAPPSPEPSTSAWNCGGDLYNCSSFGTCSQVMDYFQACLGDPSGLDGDNDGTPCETLCGSSSVQPPAVPGPQFTCNCSKTCGAMASCEEAYFQLTQCGCSRRDGDGDGVPCESICSGG